MNRREEIKTLILEMVEKIKTHYKPEKIILFGSYASDTASDESDIDLLIIKETDASFHERWVEVCDIVSETVKTIPFSPFVITPKELNQRLKSGDQFFEEILKGGKVLYGK